MLIHSYKNKPNGMGLGDFIRGSISCYQLCKKLNLHFSIDFKYHPISYYLQQNNIVYSETDIHDLQDIDYNDIRWSNDGSGIGNVLQQTVFRLEIRLLEHYKDLRILSHEDCVLYTNVWPSFPLEDDDKEFIKNSFLPSSELSKLILNSIPTDKQYEVIHIRSGDLYAFNVQVGETHNRSTEELLEKIDHKINDIKNSTEHKIIIFSDSHELKNIISNKYNLLTVNTKPTHCALETNHETIRDTLIDFFIMSRAKHIHQFSVHYWGSGFSTSINWIYDVPITIYKI
jgi:hypothetical protein